MFNTGDIEQALDLTVAWSETRQQQVKTLLHETANRLFADHHTKDALSLLTTCITRWPNDITARQQLAQGMVDLHRFHAAVQLLMETLPLTADQAQLGRLRHLLNRAIAGYDTELRQQDRRNTLLQFYRQMGAKDGSNVAYQLKQAELLIEMGQLTEGAALLQPLLFDSEPVAKQARQLQTRIDRQLARTFTDTITLTRLDNHFLVPVQVANRRLQLLLDTGASLTLVPENLADTVPGATKRAPVTLITANGTRKVATIMVPQLKLGKALLRNVPLALTPPMGMNGADGLLGMDILKRFHFVIDQEHSTLRLTPRADQTDRAQ